MEKTTRRDEMQDRRVGDGKGNTSKHQQTHRSPPRAWLRPLCPHQGRRTRSRPRPTREEEELRQWTVKILN